MLEEVAGVEAACAKLGWETVRLPAPKAPAALCAAVVSSGADVVFNLVESLGGDSRMEVLVAAVLDASGVPYTGSPPRAMFVGLYKPLARALLAFHGIPIPQGKVIGHPEEHLEDIRFPFPWIVKLSHEDASHGISTDNVVFSQEEARRRLRYLLRTYRQPVLVEEFVDGREIEATILGEGEDAEVISLSEIDFSGFPEGKPRLVTYRAKWAKRSPEYKGTVHVEVRELDPAIRMHVVRSTLKAYRMLGLRDYGRVDLRLRSGGEPVVLDVNPNPDVSPDAGLALAAVRSGMGYEGLIERIVRGALRHGVSHKAIGRGGSRSDPGLVGCDGGILPL